MPSSAASEDWSSSTSDAILGGGAAGGLSAELEGLESDVSDSPGAGLGAAVGCGDGAACGIAPWGGETIAEAC